jgi:hypothetical protein
MDRLFKPQVDARRFFADKVIQRAVVEGAPLSEDERQMLFWSETEPDSIADPVLAEGLAATISDADYETKVIGLLERSLGADVAADAGARDVWREAWSVLKQGDHDILVMIEKAVGGKSGISARAAPILRG